MEDKIKLNDKQKKILRNLAERWGEKTSEAFERLASEKVEVLIEDIALKETRTSFSKLYPEFQIAIVFGIMGDLPGLFVILSQKKEALDMMNIVNKKEFGETLKEIDKDVLGEVGNILAGNYLASLSESININAQASMPSVSLDFNKGFMEGFFVLDKEEKISLEFSSTLKSIKKGIKMKLILILNKRSFNALVN